MVTFVEPNWPGHAHTLEHASRRGTRADSAGGAVALVVSVRCALTREVVALHHTAEAVALGDAGDVDPFAGGEHVGLDHLADLEVRQVVEPELHEVLRGGRAGCRECPSSGLLKRAGLVSPNASWTAA